MIENTHVRAETERLQAEFNAGMDEGYDKALLPLPGWYFEKTLTMLTARERGYFFGRELRLQESD